MVKAADIIFFIFIIGGVFGILQATGTIPAVLGAVLNRLRSSWKMLTIVLMTAMAIGGSTLGMGEEFIPLVPIFLIVAKEIGCDRIFGVALVYVAGAVGFAAATTNPFTVNIAQEIAGLPLNSAIPFRLLFLIACLAVTLVYMLRYGSRIRRDPSTSLMGDDDFVLPTDNVEPPPLKGAHVVILVACVAIFVFILYAVQEMGWWLTQMAGGFILMGLVATAVVPIAGPGGNDRGGEGHGGDDRRSVGSGFCARRHRRARKWSDTRHPDLFGRSIPPTRADVRRCRRACWPFRRSSISSFLRDPVRRQ